jgi:hypothetical protein
MDDMICNLKGNSLIFNTNRGKACHNLKNSDLNEIVGEMKFTKGDVTGLPKKDICRLRDTLQTERQTETSRVGRYINVYLLTNCTENMLPVCTQPERGNLCYSSKHACDAMSICGRM